MTKNKVMEIIQDCIENSRAAVLCIRRSQRASGHAMGDAGCVRERFDAIYIVSESHFSKVKQLTENPAATMMFQTVSLDKVITVYGKVNIITAPSIIAETLECVGKHLHAFWNLKHGKRDLVVIEFLIEHARFYHPLNGSMEIVSFGSEES
jgi:general stress protein 26